MTLNVPHTGDAIAASDVSQTVNIEQVPSGGSEVGHYFLAGGVYASNATVQVSLRTLNHFSTPVSASVDTSDLSPAGGMGSVNIGQLTKDSAQIWSGNATGPNLNAVAGGKYTINY